MDEATELLLAEIRARLRYLHEVGLGYLQLGRGVPTLSGGEGQRIRLAAQLGSNLSGVLYVLDEPTIGLHARDNALLLGCYAEAAANILTSPQLDPFGKIPEFKFCAVRIVAGHRDYRTVIRGIPAGKENPRT